MSCSSTAASRALPGGSSICTGKGADGGPFSAVAPELGENRLLVRVFGFSTVSMVGVCFLGEQQSGDGGS